MWVESGRLARWAIVAASLQIVFAMPAGAASASWSVVSSPNQSSNSNVLQGVTCVASADCWVAGYYYTSGGSQTLTEHWNGSMWSVVSSPNPGSLSNWLYGVTCVASADCWVAGSYSVGSVNQTLTEHWNGSMWSVVSSPNQGSNINNFLYGVTCVASADCWVGGYYFTSGGSQTLTEHWNGSMWSVVSSPNPVSGSNGLYGVTCVASADCWVAGYDYSAGPGTQTLTEHWNGSMWSVVSSPNPGSNTNFLQGVTCVASADCWAAGYHFNGSSVRQTLTEHWNGSMWSLVSSPNQGSDYNFLYGVTCVGSAECWAAGYYSTSTGTQTLTEHWNGSMWSVVSSPNQGSGSNSLYGVTCVASADCWAAGYYSTGSVNQTLTEHYAVQLSPNIPDAPWIPGLALAGAMIALIGFRRKERSRGSSSDAQIP